ncbi:MAG: hypothetical protein ACRDRU_18755 [Pseudonocardiaceae bacterium]
MSLTRPCVGGLGQCVLTVVIRSTGPHMEVRDWVDATGAPTRTPGPGCSQLDRIVALAPLKLVTIAMLPLGEPVDAVLWNNFGLRERPG